jgi:hypothetical protein
MAQSHFAPAALEQFCQVVRATTRGGVLHRSNPELVHQSRLGSALLPVSQGWSTWHARRFDPENEIFSNWRRIVRDGPGRTEFLEAFPAAPEFEGIMIHDVLCAPQGKSAGISMHNLSGQESSRIKVCAQKPACLKCEISIGKQRITEGFGKKPEAKRYQT